MDLTTEIIDEKQKILIVSKKNYPFIDILKSELKKHNAEVFFSSQIPKSIDDFNYCFLINENRQLHHPHLIYLFINKKYPPLGKAKIIAVTGDDLKKNDIDRLLWFSLSAPDENLLKFTVNNLPKPYKSKWNFRLYIKKHLTKKVLTTACIMLLILMHLSFIPPLAISSFFTYRALTAFRNENITSVGNNLNLSKPHLFVSKSLYTVVRPTFLFLSLAIPIDNLININEGANNILQTSVTVFQNVGELEKLLFKKDKTAEDKSYLVLRFKKLNEEINSLATDLAALNQRIPDRYDTFKKIKTQLSEATDIIAKFKKILRYADDIFAKNGTKKYLVFFANNMELRPGGGFLGSFGILPVRDYTLEEIRVYDVYDADGQLTFHIEPPMPIKKYLGVPHLFLRDSNYSADFLENYQRARFFLEKEMNFTDFSGTILLSTTAIKNILSSFGNIYLPDFDETINDANFYLKAQMHAEDNFFPGSIQKKTFLSALTRQILINLDSVSVKKLANGVKKSLDEKQMTIYFDNPDIQTVIDQFFWSGRVIEPKCSSQTKDCLVDYLFPYDANVGANKVNFYINRSIHLKTIINSAGTIRHTLSLQYRNDSPSAAYPGGDYRNYFQILLPADSQVNRITKDGVLIEEVSEETDRFKKIGFYFELPPQKKSTIRLEYELTTVLHQGRNTYQLIVQKQIGSNNNDLILEFSLPGNIHVLGQNYSPLVKDNQIIYNTSLSADKIFFTELNKE